MPRRCSVCSSEHRNDVDRALVAGASYRDIAGQFGLSTSAVHRHAQAHLPRAAADAARVAEQGRATDLTLEVRELKGRAMAVLDRAEGLGHLGDAIKAIGEARHAISLLARLEPTATEPGGAPVRVVFVGQKPKRTETADPVPETFDDLELGLEPVGTDEGPEPPAEPGPVTEPDPAAVRRATERERRRQRLLGAKPATSGALP